MCVCVCVCIVKNHKFCCLIFSKLNSPLCFCLISKDTKCLNYTVYIKTLLLFIKVLLKKITKKENKIGQKEDEDEDIRFQDFMICTKLKNFFF